VIALLTLANLFAAVHLVRDIITSSKLFASNATGLLATGGVIWATNVIAFGLWYWDLDRGGAAARAHHPQANPAFVFPEMLHTGYAPAAWVPEFADYLSLAFWTATAFSPTDISAIKRWGQTADDDRSGRAPGHWRVGDRPRDQHPEIGAGIQPPGSSCRPLVHRAAAGDQVDQHADERDEQHEQEPSGLGPAGQVMTAEDVDKHHDQDPDPDHPQKENEHRPEKVQQRIGRIGQYHFLLLRDTEAAGSGRLTGPEPQVGSVFTGERVTGITQNG
jgi:hypothetical protein